MSTLRIDDEDSILIELTANNTNYYGAQRGEPDLSQLQQISKTAMNQVMGTLHATARKFSRTLRTMSQDESVLMPSEMEVEFMLGVETSTGGEGDVVIAKIKADAKASGQFTVKFKWLTPIRPA